MGPSWIYKLAVFLWLNDPAFAFQSYDENSNSNKIQEKDYENRNYFLIELKNNDYISSISKLHPEWNYEYEIPDLNSFHVFSLPKNNSDIDWLNKLEFIDDILENPQDHNIFKREQLDFIDNLYNNEVRGIHSLHKRKLEKRIPVPFYSEYGIDSIFKRKEDSTVAALNAVAEEFGINDPIFKQQWHIVNTGFPGYDVNVIPVWRMNITGNGIVTALIDDGLDYESADLKDNYSPEGSWDFNDNRPNPMPMLSNDYHGTRCAAEIAAVKGNEYCGVGVAYNSKVSGIRVLSAEITSEQEAAAMYYGLDVNDIYSCSWGPPDNGRSMDAPDKLVKSGMMKGILDGRNGKGALYVFASGNGGMRGDTCNFDGYTNSIYSLTVTAIDYKGLHPGYAEACTAVLVSTYSSGSGEHIHTTDINNQCSDSHGGTSAAAPLAAGIYALVLEANPEMTWRDVQYLTVLSAGEIDPSDASWQESAIEGRKYSPKYGWGTTDAEKMVKKALNWKLLKPQAWYYTKIKSPSLKIENKIGEVQNTYLVTPEILKKANFETVEQITITVSIDSGIRGAVEIDLVSPNGIVSKLALKRSHDQDKLGFRRWTFSTVAHWGEKAEGEWTLKVRNVNEGNTINFKKWQMKFFGECIDPSLAKRFDMNEDYSTINDPDSEENESNETIATADAQTDIVTTTDISIPTTTEDPTTETPITTDVQTDTNTETNNPTKTDDSYKNVESDVATITSQESMLVTTSITPINSEGEGTGDGEGESEGKGAYSSKDQSNHYIGYFSALIIAGFVIMLYIIKNRRAPGRARRREDFEFDIIRPEDDESSRFEFDDDDEDDYNISSDDDATRSNTNSNINNSIFDDDATSLDLSDAKFAAKDMRLEDTSSEFDLGNSELAGYEKTDSIIKDAKEKENDEAKLLNSKKQTAINKKGRDGERSNLLTSDSTSDDDH